MGSSVGRAKDIPGKEKIFELGITKYLTSASISSEDGKIITEFEFPEITTNKKDIVFSSGLMVIEDGTPENLYRLILGAGEKGKETDRSEGPLTMNDDTYETLKKMTEKENAMIIDAKQIEPVALFSTEGDIVNFDPTRKFLPSARDLFVTETRDRIDDKGILKAGEEEMISQQEILPEYRGKGFDPKMKLDKNYVINKILKTTPESFSGIVRRNPGLDGKEIEAGNIAKYIVETTGSRLTPERRIEALRDINVPAESLDEALKYLKEKFGLDFTLGISDKPQKKPGKKGMSEKSTIPTSDMKNYLNQILSPIDLNKKYGIKFKQITNAGGQGYLVKEGRGKYKLNSVIKWLIRGDRIGDRLDYLKAICEEYPDSKKMNQYMKHNFDIVIEEPIEGMSTVPEPSQTDASNEQYTTKPDTVGFEEKISEIRKKNAERLKDAIILGDLYTSAGISDIDDISCILKIIDPEKKKKLPVEEILTRMLNNIDNIDVQYQKSIIRVIYPNEIGFDDMNKEGMINFYKQKLLSRYPRDLSVKKK